MVILLAIASGVTYENIADIDDELLSDIMDFLITCLMLKIYGKTS
jgi:hypothetical protein